MVSSNPDMAMLRITNPLLFPLGLVFDQFAIDYIPQSPSKSVMLVAVATKPSLDDCVISIW